MSRLNAPVLVAGAILVASGLWSRRSTPPVKLDGSLSMNDARKLEVRTFWETFRKAVQERDGGRLEEALTGFDAALALDPRHEQSLYERANVLLRLHRYRDAAEGYRRLYEIHPEKSNRALLQLATTRSTFEPGAPLDLEGAWKDAGQAARKNREETGPFLALGRLAWARGDLEAAREALDVVTRLDTKAFEASFLLSLADLARGRRAGALPRLRKALETFAKDRPIAGVLSEGDTRKPPAAPDPGEVAIGQVMLLERRVTAAAAGSAPGLGDLDRVAPAGAPAWIRLAGSAPGPTMLVPDRSGRLRAFVMESGPDAGFTEGALPAGLAPGFAVAGITICDLNGDGLEDAVLLGGSWHGVGPVRVALQGKSGFVARGIPGLPERSGAARALVGDADGDHRPDLVLLGAGWDATPGESVSLWLGDGRGGFRKGPPVDPGSGTGCSSDGLFRDLDGNGRADLLVLGWPGGLRFLAGDGAGRFVDRTAASGLSRAVSGLAVAAADLDGDGDAEILVSQHAPYPPVLAALLGRKVAGAPGPILFENRGAGRFAPVEGPGLSDPMGTVHVLVTDVDGDGRSDLLFANGALSVERQEPVALFANRGKLAFTRSPLPGPLARVEKSWRIMEVPGAGGQRWILSLGGGLAPGDRWPGGAYRCPD